jgi:electron transport complex protein RnfD
MKEKEYTFDASYQPQVRAKRDTRSVMLDVIIGLLPALAVGIWQFGAAILVNLVISIGVCVLFEYLYRHWMHKNNMIGDLSAVVTGLLMVLILPPSCPWWVIVIGDAFAIIVVKQLYGGLGKNFLNPALAGRAFLFSSYTAMLTTWSIPASLKGLDLGSRGGGRHYHGHSAELYEGRQSPCPTCSRSRPCSLARCPAASAR